MERCGGLVGGCLGALSNVIKQRCNLGSVATKQGLVIPDWETMVDLTDAILFCQHLRLTQAPKILCGNLSLIHISEPTRLALI
eukprot:1935500-Alexandrium_andersonii.AAC.1